MNKKVILKVLIDPDNKNETFFPIITCECPQDLSEKNMTVYKKTYKEKEKRYFEVFKIMETNEDYINFLSLDQDIKNVDIILDLQSEWDSILKNSELTDNLLN